MRSLKYEKVEKKNPKDPHTDKIELFRLSNDLLPRLYEKMISLKNEKFEKLEA